MPLAPMLDTRTSHVGQVVRVNRSHNAHHLESNSLRPVQNGQVGMVTDRFFLDINAQNKYRRLEDVNPRFLQEHKFHVFYEVVLGQEKFYIHGNDIESAD